MAGGNVQGLACGCSPGPLWLKAKGIKEVFDSQVLIHVVQWLDVSHINICTWILRRVSYAWLQTSSLELIRALSSLPPFCTILHECINFRWATASLSDSAINSFLKSKTNGPKRSPARLLRIARRAQFCMPKPSHFYRDFYRLSGARKKLLVLR